LVNSTNLDYFQPQHQAELFRLKGQFMQALGERDQANSNYSTALTIWDQLPDGWLSWGSHCDEMYESSGNHAWLEYAVSCYLQAVKHGSCAGRTMLPRVLHLLSFENDTGAVGRALDRKLNEVWVRVRALGLTFATWWRDALQSLLFSVQLSCVA
jgi:transformation/transcription domain-associated protein